MIHFTAEQEKIGLIRVDSEKEHQGYVLNIMNNAKAAGYDMLCYPVSERMKMILSRFGFVITEDGWLYKNEKQHI